MRLCCSSEGKQFIYSDAKERYSRPIRDSYETVVIEMDIIHTHSTLYHLHTLNEGFKE